MVEEGKLEPAGLEPDIAIGRVRSRICMYHDNDHIVITMMIMTSMTSMTSMTMMITCGEGFGFCAGLAVAE